MNFLNYLKLLRRRGRKLIPLVKSILIENEVSFNQVFRNSLFILLQSHANTISCERGEIEWILDIDDHGISRKIFANGSYQITDIQQLLQFLEKHNYLGKKLVIDIGANIGTTCIPIAKLTDLNLLAIEPIPTAYKLLVNNVDQNSLSHRITCVPSAVTSQSGYVEMVFNNRAYGESEVLIKDSVKLNSSEATYKKNISVLTAPLDYILSKQEIQVDQVAFVWSDTEGCETEVINTGKKLWRNNVPLYTELYPLKLEHHGGIEEFVKQAKRNFSYLVTKEELVSKGANAEVAPIETLEAIVDSLNREEKVGTNHTDVLLLPGK